MKKAALVCSNYISRTFNPCSDVTVLYLLWYRAAGSNLRMVSPSSMSVVKPLMIHACKVRGKILNLATFSSHALQLQTGIYHYFALLPCKEPQNLEKTQFSAFFVVSCWLKKHYFFWLNVFSLGKGMILAGEVLQVGMKV